MKNQLSLFNYIWRNIDVYLSNLNDIFFIIEKDSGRRLLRLYKIGSRGFRNSRSSIRNKRKFILWVNVDFYIFIWWAFFLKETIFIRLFTANTFRRIFAKWVIISFKLGLLNRNSLLKVRTNGFLTVRV